MSAVSWQSRGTLHNPYLSTTHAQYGSWIGNGSDAALRPAPPPANRPSSHTGDILQRRLASTRAPSIERSISDLALARPTDLEDPSSKFDLNREGIKESTDPGRGTYSSSHNKSGLLPLWKYPTNTEISHLKNSPNPKLPGDPGYTISENMLKSLAQAKGQDAYERLSWKRKSSAGNDLPGREIRSDVGETLTNGGVSGKLHDRESRRESFTSSSSWSRPQLRDLTNVAATDPDLAGSRLNLRGSSSNRYHGMLMGSNLPGSLLSRSENKNPLTDISSKYNTRDTTETSGLGSIGDRVSSEPSSVYASDGNAVGDVSARGGRWTRQGSTDMYHRNQGSSHLSNQTLPLSAVRHQRIMPFVRRSDAAKQVVSRRIADWIESNRDELEDPEENDYLSNVVPEVIVNNSPRYYKPILKRASALGTAGQSSRLYNTEPSNVPSLRARPLSGSQWTAIVRKPASSAKRVNFNLAMNQVRAYQTD